MIKYRPKLDEKQLEEVSYYGTLTTTDIKAHRAKVARVMAPKKKPGLTTRFKQWRSKRKVSKARGAQIDARLARERARLAKEQVARFAGTSRTTAARTRRAARSLHQKGGVAGAARKATAVKFLSKHKKTIAIGTGLAALAGTAAGVAAIALAASRRRKRRKEKEKASS